MAAPAGFVEGLAYPLTVGSSFAGGGTAAFTLLRCASRLCVCALRLLLTPPTDDFKPASVDATREGTLEVDDEQRARARFATKAGGEIDFEGTFAAEEGELLEAVLVLEDGRARVEVLGGQALGLKQVSTKRATVAPPPLARNARKALDVRLPAAAKKRKALQRDAKKAGAAPAPARPAAPP